jgi:hypothetical protein
VVKTGAATGAHPARRQRGVVTKRAGLVTARPATIEGMATSLYKGPALGKLPPCLICAGPGEGPREILYLTRGVMVWLCAAHRAPAFLTRRAGRDLVASLGALWSAAGCFGARRRRALEDHLRRVRQPPAAPRPGSYSWPELRREAERRFGAGEPPGRVIGELRARHAGLPARVPSLRTMRRWFSDGRWLPRGSAPGPAPAGRPPGGAPRVGPPPAARRPPPAAPGLSGRFPNRCRSRTGSWGSS